MVLVVGKLEIGTGKARADKTTVSFEPSHPHDKRIQKLNNS